MASEFIEPMCCLLVQTVPAGDEWLYEVKWDGYRAIGIKDGTRTKLYSRRGKSFSSDFPAIEKGLADLKCQEAVVDGEIIAVDEEGRPVFQQLQQRKSRTAHLKLVLFDV